MAIDNASLKLDSLKLDWIADEIEIVSWFGDQGSGFVEYNDRPRVKEKIVDLVPYVPTINEWIDAASKLSAPLSLDQAKQIKTELVDALYQNKLRRPYLYGGWQYDTSDEAIGNMTAIAASTGLIRRIDEEFRRLVGESGISGTINGNVYQNNVSAGVVNEWSGAMRDNWAYLTLIRVNYTTADFATTATGFFVHIHATRADLYGFEPNRFEGHYGTGAGTGGARMSDVNAVSVTSGGASEVNWQPLNWASRIDINADNFRNALHAIVNQRNALNERRIALKNYIRDYPWISISELAAFDVVGGW